MQKGREKYKKLNINEKSFSYELKSIFHIKAVICWKIGYSGKQALQIVNLQGSS